MGKRLKRGYYWRGGVVWTRDPVTGKRASTHCRDPGAAEAWRAERERLAADPRHAASLTATVGEWVMRTIRSKEAMRAEGTVTMYESKLGHVVRLFGKDAPLAAITPGAVDDYITARRREGVKNNTIARELTCLRQMLRLAKRGGAYGLDLDDVMPIGFSALYKPVTRTLLLSDVPRLMAALRTDEERAWVCFALAFAADSSDVERARPEHWDAARGLMFVHGTKTATRSAWLPVLAHVRELAEFAIGRLPISWTRASKGVGEACARAGIPHLSPKDLRRSAATWLIEAGADQSFVSRFMRHKSDTMVRLVYGQMRPERLGHLLGATASEIPALDAIVVPGEEVVSSVENGTDASQLAQPLGGIGRRGGFKRPHARSRNTEDEPDSALPCVAEGCDGTRIDATVGTEASQQDPDESAFAAALQEHLGAVPGGGR